MAGFDPKVARRAERVCGTCDEVLIGCVAQDVGAMDVGHDARTLAALLLITVQTGVHAPSGRRRAA
ncbi:hypothetical protein [Actinoplanes sp. N902-109]|uniref:hypothetical protein n=1 Tax=Actinoplanes sp. (strain N902-109) TaxID=649831 RepID=UPI0003293AE1|nr:hypothetical protein [Actinoplanes sp. N902-109]AGL14831.1 hypothetical protein L083_1321 [Actinoplanes sp. N902-109]